MSKKRFHKKPLALAVGLLLTTQVQANTINVDAGCSLIDAITAANTNVPTNGCVGGSIGADTIALPANSTITLTTVNNSSANYTGIGGNGLPVILSNITIEGNGSTIQRSDATLASFRIAAVMDTGDLTLKDTTISGGISINQFSGGGLLVQDGGTLTITKSTVSNNSSTGFAGGGGIGNQYGTLNVIDSTISGNTANSHGGGIAAYKGSNYVTNSTISGNTTFGSGGGLHLNFSGVALTHSTVANNDAASGFFTQTLANGISHYGSAVFLDSSILSNGGFECANTQLGFIQDDGNNWISDATCGVIVAGAGSIKLGPLDNNGGPTLTHALTAGSAAIDALPAGECGQSVDQRGIARPQGAACDIGAFELVGSPVIDDEGIEEIISFFEDGLTNGTLEGYSPSSNQKARDRAETALSNQFKTLATFIDDDDIDAACNQLDSTLKHIHTGGPLLPKHFVTGADAVELADKLILLDIELECHLTI